MNEKEAHIECKERERTSSSGSAIRREGKVKSNKCTPLSDGMSLL